jgi:rhodanese-related sulfurtransferase
VADGPGPVVTGSEARAVAGNVDDLLATARSRYARLNARETAAAIEAGALVVDTRPIEQRALDGEIPGAIVVARNVLEWRLAPADRALTIPELRDRDQTVVVVCQGGFASSLAAATLIDLGIANATDLEGGVDAWIAAGLPTVPAGTCVDRTPSP